MNTNKHRSLLQILTVDDTFPKTLKEMKKKLVKKKSIKLSIDTFSRKKFPMNHQFITLCWKLIINIINASKSIFDGQSYLIRWWWWQRDTTKLRLSVADLMMAELMPVEQREIVKDDDNVEDDVLNSKFKLFRYNITRGSVIRTTW